MPTYIKPNGKEIDISNNSVKLAEDLGWKKKEELKEKVKKLKSHKGHKR